MPKTALREKQITEIRALAALPDANQTAIAKSFGIHKSRVSRIASGESFRDGAAGASRSLPMNQIRPDPDQPRKTFDPEELADLAASIAEVGLIQPITVRVDPQAESRFLIVAGERRYRAFQMNSATEIPARVAEFAPAEVRVAQIVENLQRAGLNPVEEGTAYRAILEETGWSVAELGRRLGLKHIVKITDRMSLLSLRPEYQQLIGSGQLTQSQGFELSRLPPARQSDLFNALRTGKATSQAAMRQFANAMIDHDAQPPIFTPHTAPAATSAHDVTAMTRLEYRINRALDVLELGFDDNEIVAAKRVDPNKAAIYADKLALIQKALGQMERALRYSAAQLAFEAAA